MVAKGFEQNIFCSSGKDTYCQGNLFILGAQGCKIFQLVIKSAFVNGDLDVEIYMNQPKELVVESKESLVCELQKSLYGIKFDIKKGGEFKIFCRYWILQILFDKYLYVLNQR